MRSAPFARRPVTDLPASQRFVFRIEPDEAGVRLDVFLAEQEDPPVTRSQVKRRVESGEIEVNGRQVKAGYTLRAGDELVWSYTPSAQLSAAPQELPLDILFEDLHLAIIDKPAGMVVHPSVGHPDGTLVNAVLHHFGQVAPTDDELRPGIVHRIDKDTSGAIVITKTAAAHRYLSELFATHDIERTYHALVMGPRLDDEGTFETTHARHPTDRLRYTGRRPEGRRAVTHYRVLERFPSGAALVECRLETGRTHQIRMHFAEANAPLLGDAVYAPPGVATTRIIGRQALHARTLGFEHIDQTWVCVTAPYPADFAHALELLRQGKPV